VRIALIGTRGVPAHYGGFETCVEEVGSRLAAAGHHVRVYCRPTDASERERLDDYLGMQLIHLPVVHRRSLETLSHTALSVFHRSLTGADAAVVFNAANSPLLPVIRARGIPVATHVDGLEWRRAKWGRPGQHYYRAAEALAVRWSDALIAEGISDYFEAEFGAPTDLITYGAPILESVGSYRVAELGLQPQGYHLVVARFEPENHVREIVEGYVRSDALLPLVVVGSAPYADAYTAEVAAAADDRVRLLGGLWDQEQINELYANALSYLHGHSVGGTNPSLLRAAGAATFTIAYDVNFNREVLGVHAEYFQDPEDVAQLVMKAEGDPKQAEDRGLALQDSVRRYNWADVAAQYADLCARLSRGEFPRRRPSGRRRNPGYPFPTP